MMIETTAKAQSLFLSSRPDQARKELGQYYTGAPTAYYMASMLQPFHSDKVRILDAGAGTGILTVAATLRCLEFGNRDLHAVLYEIDKHALEHLQETMESLAGVCSEYGARFTYEIRHHDFVLERPDHGEVRYDVSLINPPYFKYSSRTSPYAGVTADLYKGNPNIYASFTAIVSACMADTGQMVVIIPRSFTNGLYFKGFRRYLNSAMNLKKIHIFRARNKVFKEHDVLQENVICAYQRGTQSETIDICTSEGNEDLGGVSTATYPTSLIIDASSDHEIIRIPESQEDARIIETVEQWESSFQENGYFISTGRVVEHRTRPFITSPQDHQNSVPLFRMHNVRAFTVSWSGEHKKDVRFCLAEGHDKHTSDNRPYVILKRFSSKDEKRRLVAGVSNPSEVGGKLIALENHLNYIGAEDGTFDLIEAYGLALLLNSTLVDKYFRCVSGNTQVNATEIRLLKLPPRSIIRRMGEIFQTESRMGQASIDDIVDAFVGTKTGKAA